MQVAHNVLRLNPLNNTTNDMSMGFNDPFTVGPIDADFFLQFIKITLLLYMLQ